MKHYLSTALAMAGFALLQSQALLAEDLTISSPDGQLKVLLSLNESGQPQYCVMLGDDTVIEASKLGLNTTVGDFTQGLSWGQASALTTVSDTYDIATLKRRNISYTANEQTVTFKGANGKEAIDITFHVDNTNVAFRYKVYRQKEERRDERVACLVNDEATDFVMPQGTTTFLCPQMTPQTGFARTAPSYETYYEYDGEMGKNGHGRGFTFPALFKVKGNEGSMSLKGSKGSKNPKGSNSSNLSNSSNSIWVMLCETDVAGNYCGSRLECKDNSYKVTYPEMTEFGGVGSVEPGLMLPGYTPWRTITVGRSLAPIAETSIMWDLVKPLYEPSQQYEYGKSTWSWIIRMDASCNYDEQKEYIDLAADLGWQYVLIDAWWDANIGYEKMEELSKYAASKGIGLFLWYNSNGYWNDAPQGPRGKLHRMIDRRKEMAWLKKAGIKGLKVDFIGSDKQQTMQMYEDIMADANEAGLMMIFHGCTIPRGWERMFPNFVACEAARVSENLAFGQYDNDIEALAATIHPVLRNSIGNMDFGGSTLNKHYSKNNERGTTRKTSDVYALATAILFQTPVQNFALTPNNLTDAPAWAVDFMKKVPTLWQDMKMVEGYPGKYIVMARQDNEGQWYLAGVNATREPLKVTLDLGLFSEGQKVSLYLNNEMKTVKVTKKLLKKGLEVVMPSDGGFVVTSQK